jgi:fermentation-respiration switch protein FrsA (DUF1100 family)
MAITRSVAGVACAAALLVACASSGAGPAELASYRALRGQLVSVETTSIGERGRYGAARVRLTSNTGLSTTGWIYHPRNTTTCHPAVLLQNGREENSGVIARLPADFGDVVVLSLDYPPAMPMTLGLTQVVNDRARIQSAARQIPALFSLGAQYLAGRSDVDASRIAIAATSFAVPFASIAAAFDTTFRNVALVYGAGDLPQVIAANLTLRPRAVRRPLAWMATRPFAEFAPERFIAHIAPRPVVMVNGMDDPQMPVDAVRQLYDAAREPKSIVWLRTGHLMPADSALIRSLVDTAFARIPVLHDTAPAGRCAAR